MGSANIDAEAQDDEKPQHTVYLDGFWIMRTEVTNAEYKQCVNANACSQPNNDTWDKAENGQYPVTDVNWNQANAYTKWVGGRLPTEAEWEKAARSTDGRIYPWGNTWDGNRVNFCDRNCEAGSRDNTIDDGYARTSPVGAYSKGASPYGAVDMAGNVWEWVADWYAPDYYKNSPERNPLGPETGNRRILCGGAWNHPRNDMRVAVRFHNNPSDTHNNVGFRVVRNDSSEGRVFTDPKAYQTVISQLKIPTLVDFESIDAGPVTNTITDRTAFNGTAYVDQGITFFSPSGLPLYIAPGGLFWNSSNSLSVGGFPYDTTPSTDDRLLVTFEPSVLAVGFTIIDHDPENQNSSIQFLDANDQVVKESPIPPDYAPFRAFIGIVSVDQPIARVRVVDSPNDGDDVNYDDFIFVR
jgi:hypothetical protein